MRQFISEFTGTFILVFCGTGAITINEVQQGSIGNLGIAITFGLVVSALIYTLGNISGAHINPAVSMIFYIKKELSLQKFFGFLIAQFSGAILASVFVALLFTESKYLGSSLPSGSVWQSFILEIFLSFFLVLVILRVSELDKKHHMYFTGAVVGGVVLLEALFAGPVCGASMNPARSLGPALVSGNMQHLWVYVTAPCIGALAGLGLNRILTSTSH